MKTILAFILLCLVSSSESQPFYSGYGFTDQSGSFLLGNLVLTNNGQGLGLLLSPTNLTATGSGNVFNLSATEFAFKTQIYASNGIDIISGGLQSSSTLSPNGTQLGVLTSVHGDKSVVIGYFDSDNGNAQTVGVGSTNNAWGTNAIGLGQNTAASNNAVAIGFNTGAGSDDIVIGRNSQSGAATNSVALGYAVTNTANNQILAGPGVAFTGLSALTNAAGNSLVDQTVTNAINSSLTALLNTGLAGNSNWTGVISTNATNFAKSIGASITNYAQSGNPTLSNLASAVSTTLTSGTNIAIVLSNNATIISTTTNGQLNFTNGTSILNIGPTGITNIGGSLNLNTSGGGPSIDISGNLIGFGSATGSSLQVANGITANTTLSAGAGGFTVDSSGNAVPNTMVINGGSVWQALHDGQTTMSNLTVNGNLTLQNGSPSILAINSLMGHAPEINLEISGTLGWQVFEGVGSDHTFNVFNNNTSISDLIIDYNTDKTSLAGALSVSGGVTSAGITNSSLYSGSGSITSTNGSTTGVSLHTDGTVWTNGVRFTGGSGVFSGHIIGTGSSPTILAGGSTGSPTSVSLDANATDTCGTITLNYGVTAGNALACTVTFASAFATISYPLISIADGGTSLANQFSVSGSAGSWTVRCDTTLSANVSVVINYIVAGK